MKCSCYYCTVTASKYNTVQCSTASTLQCSNIMYRTVQYSGAVQCKTVQQYSPSTVLLYYSNCTDVLFCSVFHCTVLLLYCAILLLLHYCTKVVIYTQRQNWFGTCSRYIGVISSRATTTTRYLVKLARLCILECSMRSCPTRECLPQRKELRVQLDRRRQAF